MKLNTFFTPRILTRAGAFLFSALLCALPAMANDLTSATATADCSGYSLSVTAINLNVGEMYTIDYSFTLTCGGSPSTVTGSFNFTAASSSQTVTNGGTWPGTPLSTNCTASNGSATITNSGSTVAITFSGTGSTSLMCGGGGCPATIGFWKNESKHPFPMSVQTSGLTIGGVVYSEADLYTILNSNGGNAVTILGKQLVGALLNLAAGGKHNTTADGAITTAETLLQANNLNLLTSNVSPSTSLGSALVTQAGILNDYNNSDFNTCSEGTGLTVGP